MSYQDHFRLADDLIIHLDASLAGVNDAFIKSRYSGFLAVSSVTVLELCLKTIFLDFAASKHKVLGTFCGKHFDRINGRIALRNIREEYLPRFGEKYLVRFNRKIKSYDELEIMAGNGSPQTAYNNLLVWRNAFAHEGTIPNTATYDEVKQAYAVGKKIIEKLAESMIR